LQKDAISFSIPFLIKLVSHAYAKISYCLQKGGPFYFLFQLPVEKNFSQCRNTIVYLFMFDSPRLPYSSTKPQDLLGLTHYKNGLK
jgi:hypothetical protein